VRNPKAVLSTILIKLMVLKVKIVESVCVLAQILVGTPEQLSVCFGSQGSKAARGLRLQGGSRSREGLGQDPRTAWTFRAGHPSDKMGLPLGPVRGSKLKARTLGSLHARKNWPSVIVTMTERSKGSAHLDRLRRTAIRVP
jgi:hypothetical protein